MCSNIFFQYNSWELSRFIKTATRKWHGRDGFKNYFPPVPEADKSEIELLASLDAGVGTLGCRLSTSWLVLIGPFLASLKGRERLWQRHYSYPDVLTLMSAMMLNTSQRSHCSVIIILRAGLQQINLRNKIFTPNNTKGSIKNTFVNFF